MPLVLKEKASVYFKGLHALRFIAALLVLISHVEMIKEGHKIGNIYGNGTFLAKALEELGPMGVSFFFVLSGFLITYLLLAERERTHKVAIKKFYWRRILRIWPLYFLFTFLAFFILPQIPIFHHYYFSPLLENNFYTKLAMYLFFVPGFVLAFFQSVPWAGHLWSIGVEEQFYLVWPWVIKKLKSGHLLFLMLLIFVVSVKVIIFFLLKYYNYPLWLKEIAAQSKFECMIIGGWVAYIFYNKAFFSYLKILARGNALLLLAILVFCITWFIPAFLQDIQHIIIAPFFAAIIVGVIQNNKLSFLEHPALIFLGNISYGFYVYHMMCVVICLRLMPDAINLWCLNNTGGSVLINILYYVGSFLITIIVSAFSYFFFERYFLRLKRKYSVILSGK